MTESAASANQDTFVFHVGVIMLTRGALPFGRGLAARTDRIVCSHCSVVIFPCAWRDDDARKMGVAADGFAFAAGAAIGPDAAGVPCGIGRRGFMF